MTRILKLVLMVCGLLLLAAYPAYAAGSVEIQPYFESGEGINDATGFRYHFYVVENEGRDSLKSIRGISKFKGNPSQNYLIETGVYSFGTDYSNYSCSDNQGLTGQTNPAEASLRIGLPYSIKSSLPGVKTNNPAIFPKVTYETETKDQARAELVSQLNLNGKQGMIEISKGGPVTDKSGWLCEKDLEDIDYLQWNITASIDSEERIMALALPKDAASSLASGALFNIQAESLHSSGAFKVYYWGIEVRRSSGQWEGIDQWKVASYDGSLTDYGARKVKYNNTTVIEISNDSSQGDFLAEGEVFSLSAPEDSSPPSGSLSINSGAEYANAKSLTLNLSARDDTGITGYYLSEESLAPAKDKEGWVSLSPGTAYNGDITYSLKEEANTANMLTLHVWYKDAAENISETASDSISFDLTAPSLTITSPTTASTFNTKEASLTLSGTASDNASGIEKITYTGAQGATGTAIGTTNWSIPSLKLSKGENVFTITAYDKLNNSVQASFTANCEVVEPPETPIFNQKYEGKAVNSGSLSWSWGPAESGGPVEEYWVSPSWLPNGFSTKEASYSLTKKLSKGTYQISIMAKNSAGISKKVKDIVVIIEENSAEESSSQTKNETTQAQTSDKSETTASSEVSNSDTTTSQEETGTEIETAAKTKSESKSSAKSDTASSQETYSTPTGFLAIEDGQTYVNYKRIKLNLSASDDSGITAYYLSDSSDTPSATSENGWTSVDKVSLLDKDIYYALPGSDGDKNIYVWFKNSSGRLSSGYNESIGLDTTDPEIEDIDYETPSSGKANLSIKADDEDSGIKSVKWEKGAAQGTAIYQESSNSWSIKSVALADGDNEITVTVEDNAGNTAQKKITIAYSSGAGSEDSVPHAPSNLSLEVKSSSEIDLSWEDNSSNEDGFKVERRLEDEDFTVIYSADSGKTTFSDSGLKAGKQYYYRLKAYNSFGDSSYSDTAKAQTDNEAEIREDISTKMDFIKSSLDRKDSEINDYFGSEDNWEKFLEYNGYIYAALRGIKANKWESTSSLTDKERGSIFESLSGIIKSASFLKEANEPVDLDKDSAYSEDNYLPAAIRELLYINLMSVYNEKDDFLNHKKEIADTLGLDENKENIISMIFYDFDTLFILDVETYEQALLEDHIYRVLEEIPYQKLYSQPLAITARGDQTAQFMEEGPEIKTGRINIEEDLNITDVFYKLNANIWSNIEAGREDEDKNRITKAYSLIQRAGLTRNNYLRNYSGYECDLCAKNDFFTDTDEDNTYCFELNERISLKTAEIESCGLLKDKGERKYCINLDDLKSEQANACSGNCGNCFIFYLALPEELFPHLAKAWLNTADALSQARESLGDEESDTRYYGPLNQFLFFADIYSQGGANVKVYELDKKNSDETSDDVLKSRDAGIERDDYNRIKSITIENIKYQFEVDDEGYASGCQKEEALTNTSTDYKPFAYTLGVTGKTDNSAKLRGKVNAKGLSTQVKFEYGTSSGAYDYATAEESADGSNDKIVSIKASGLSAAKTYYYRVTAVSSDGTSYGEEKTFTTEADTVIWED